MSIDRAAIVGQGSPPITLIEMQMLTERALQARLDPTHTHRFNNAQTRCIDCEATGPKGTSLEERAAEQEAREARLVVPAEASPAQPAPGSIAVPELTVEDADQLRRIADKRTLTDFGKRQLRAIARRVEQHALAAQLASAGKRS